MTVISLCAIELWGILLVRLCAVLNCFDCFPLIVDEFPEPDIAFEELFPDLEEPMPPDDAEEGNVNC